MNLLRFPDAPRVRRFCALVLLTCTVLLPACGGSGGGSGNNSNACGLENCSPQAVISTPSITAYAGQGIELNGSRSTPNGALTYRWEQTEGESVAITNSNEPIARLIAPIFNSEKTLTFRLIVSNGYSDSIAEIGVIVKPLMIAAQASTTTAVVGNPVLLRAVGGDGSGSTQYLWEQIDIADITLSIDNASSAEASFTTRIVPNSTSAKFRVTATNQFGAAVQASTSVNLAAGIIPSVTALTPSHAAPGEEIKISGSGFSGTIEVGASNSTGSKTVNYRVISDHEIRLSIPNMAAGKYNLQVQNSGGISNDSLIVGSPLSHVTQVTSGHSHFCAITDGSVQCWGDNSYGQLGDQTKTFRSFPATVVESNGYTLQNVKMLSSGMAHNCALLENGSVFCWGGNSHNELANGQTTDSPHAQKVDGLPPNIAAIESGGFHQCAVTTEGETYCWGYNGYGQLGYSTTNSSSGIPLKIQNLPALKKMALGVDQTCSITLQTNELLCWGRNTSGQLGNGDNQHSTNAVKVNFENGLYPIDIAAGPSHTCALLDDLSIHCWGDNRRGQLGTQDFLDSNLPVRVKPPASDSDSDLQFSKIFASRSTDRDSAGAGGTCAITTAKKLYCWGDNNHGQLGDYTYRSNPSPTQVKDIASVDSLAMSKASTCALAPTKSGNIADGLVCWGAQSTGELGLDEIGPGSRPMVIDGSDTNMPAIAISTGGEGLISQGFSCALFRNATVGCWGHNAQGQLGNGTTYDQSNPTPVGLTGVTAISSGTAHTCAVSHGSVYCWGANESIQLGSISSGDALYENAPVAISGLTGINSISAGAAHTCAITLDGVVWCWGAGYAGLQRIIGFPSTDGDPKYITSGGGHSCVILESQRAYCWGANMFGQMGDGTNLASSTPHRVLLPEQVKAQNIDAGTFHTCATTTTGQTYCWGSNEMGQLGYKGASSNIPVIVADVSDARQIQASGLYGFHFLPFFAHSCALIGSNSGNVFCWGNNLFYQLGNESRRDQSTPSAVKGLHDIKQISSSGMHSCALYTDGNISCWGGPFMAQLGQRPLKPRAVLRAPD